MITHHLLEHEIRVEITLTGELARTLLEHAEARKKEPIVVLADRVETALRDNLIDAILDDAT